MTHYRLCRDAAFSEALPWSIYEMFGEAKAFAGCKASFKEAVDLLEKLAVIQGVPFEIRVNRRDDMEAVR